MINYIFIRVNDKNESIIGEKNTSPDLFWFENNFQLRYNITAQSTTIRLSTEVVIRLEELCMNPVNIFYTDESVILIHHY